MSRIIAAHKRPSSVSGAHDDVGPHAPRMALEAKVPKRREPKDELCALVGRNLRDARRRAGLTQMEVAHQLGSAGTYVGAIERGDANITLGTLARVAAVIGIDPRSLVLGLYPREDPSQTLETAFKAMRVTVRNVITAHDAGEANLKALDEILTTIVERTRRRDLS